MEYIMKIYVSLITLITVFLFAVNNPSQAHDHKNATTVGGLIISNIWARVTPKTSKTGVAFFIIKNKSKSDNVLLGVSSEIAKKTEIHHGSIENNIMRMRRVGNVNLPAGSVTELKPGSFHIMFIGLYKPIKEGDLFPLILTFKTDKNVKVLVKAFKLPEKSPIDHSKMK
jgi:copper(I)-binding protein